MQHRAYTVEDCAPLIDGYSAAEECARCRASVSGHTQSHTVAQAINFQQRAGSALPHGTKTRDHLRLKCSTVSATRRESGSDAMEHGPHMGATVASNVLITQQGMLGYALHNCGRNERATVGVQRGVAVISTRPPMGADGEDDTRTTSTSNASLKSLSGLLAAWGTGILLLDS